MQKQNWFKSPTFAGILGNILEWYDFALYGHFSVLISRHFFPEGDRILATFAVFSVSFFMRPLGAMVFSAIGDRHGRKKALSLSILGMAAPTAAIGFLPDYDQIGVWATVLLVSFRLLQGMALGGEMGGAITFVMEHTPRHRVGSASAWVQASTCLGLLAGTLTASSLGFLMDQPAFDSWGWRIPFILGIFAAWLGYRIRKSMSESAVFEIARNENRLQKNPLGEIKGRYWREALIGIGIVSPMTCGFFFCFVYFNSYLVTGLGLASQEALQITSIGLLLSLITTLISGRIADRIGYKPILQHTALLMLIVSAPLTVMASGAFGMLPTLVAYFSLSLLLGAYCSTAFASVTALFPTPIRYSGISITVNLASPLFGSTAPLLAAALIEYLGAPLGFQWFAGYFLLLWILAWLAVQRTNPKAFQGWGHL
jgi:MFS transporter, MHS family, proline/betaine transporter